MLLKIYKISVLHHIKINYLPHPKAIKIHEKINVPRRIFNIFIGSRTSDEFVNSSIYLLIITIIIIILSIIIYFIEEGKKTHRSFISFVKINFNSYFRES